ncbi:FkbM family methyltransferase [Phyllobacterium sp. 628]|uniref:FkbM family methyltransferase n=1 Tax=Phyllobacterium sp. 628 TaxID=2718938 RepID=UPI001AEE95C2|nr:FkbM family methyltransferase [Phyllobacterium sp. 628]
MLEQELPEIDIIRHTLPAHTRRGTMHVLPQDDPISRSIVQYGEWAEAEIEFLLNFIMDGDIVIDVGANVGSHAIAFSQKTGPNGEVIAFEPQSSIAAILDHNIQLLGCHNVTIRHAGAGEAAGEMFAPCLDYKEHANFGSVSLQERKDQNNERVPIVAIDDLALSRLHFIKIDAEGMDAAVLTGMKLTLGRTRPVIYLECNSIDEGAEIMRALDWSRYKIFLVRTAAYNPENFTKSTDNIFGVAKETGLLIVPEEKLRLVAASTDTVEVIPVNSLQTLAEALLATPRYGDLTDYDRNWEKLLGELRDLQEQMRIRTWDIKRLEFREASLTAQLNSAKWQRIRQSIDGCPNEINALKEQIRIKEAAISAIYASSSWRLSRPLRLLKKLVSKPSNLRPV